MNFTNGKMQVSLSFSLAVVFCVSALLPGKLVPQLFIAILLHEGGHFLYILMSGKRVEKIRLTLMGIRVTLAENGMSQREELWLNLCGPAVNLLLGGLLLAVGETMQMMRLTAVNLAVAAATLIPLGASDGTVILDILLERYCGIRTERGRRWLRWGIAAAMASGLLAVGGAFG